uniref:C-type lectin domain-containing protein n=1 Tax=Sphaeramia orbicularis TaxID=375764 RepID=A0A673AMR2_9TELE
FAVFSFDLCSVHLSVDCGRLWASMRLSGTVFFIASKLDGNWINATMLSRPRTPGVSGGEWSCGRSSAGPDARIPSDNELPLSERRAAATVIKYDFIRRAGQKYFVSFKERGSLSKAVDFCSQQGLQLALPQNEENNTLTQMFGEGDKTAWITQGNFAVDLKNQPLVFTKWAEGQPDRSVQDTGCTMLTENGFCTVTQECSLQAYIICQL